MKRGMVTALLLAGLVGCTSGSPSPEQAREVPAQDPAVLPERFAAMDPDEAARRGPGGIGQAREVYHELLRRHEAIDRQVTDLPNGVLTLTTSEDPEIAALIRLHVRQMVARFEQGLPVRRWDPLYAELVKHMNRS